VRVNEPTDKIVLHANELEIQEASLTSVALQLDAPLRATSIALQKDDETAHLAFAQSLPSGTEATLTIKFGGVLNDLMVGFYRSKYTDGQGATKNMATTQFEPTDARRAFPCWDEPMQKATFAVTLRVRENLTALSNMDVSKAVSLGDGLKEVSFNTTPIMSTYLLAFVVGELEYIESYTSGAHNGRPIPCRIYTAPGKSEKGRFALNVAVQVLEYFADVFGIEYPLPKLDQIAISDFEAGAMENWGLITYREVALLVDEATTSSRAKQHVAYVLEGGKQIQVRQNRYLSAGVANVDEDQTLWWVPLGIETSASKDQHSTDVLTAREATFDLETSSAKWYKLNKDTVGIYRVKYPANAVANLAQAIANGELSTNDRIGVIADAASLASSGHSNTSDFLTFLRAYSNETEFVAWQEIVLRIDALQSVWATESNETRENLRALSRTLFSPLVQRLSWDAIDANEDSLVSRLRALAIRAAGFAGDNDVVSETNRRFQAFFAGDRSVFNTDTLRAAFAVAIRNGGRDEYEKVKSYYLDSANPVDQQLAALSSLGFTTDPALVDELLEFALTDAVRNQDVHQAIVAINTHGANRERLWQWYQDKYDLLVARYRASMNYMGILVRLSIAEFVGDAKADEVERYFADKNTAKFQRVIDQSLEKIRSNTVWLNKDREDVEGWFASNRL
ncbi:hypothetical protein GGI16_006213, partial [Coemansia sp. S142-1]